MFEQKSQMLVPIFFGNIKTGNVVFDATVNRHFPKSLILQLCVTSIFCCYFGMVFEYEDKTKFKSIEQ